MDIAKNIREIRLKKSINQQVLADALEVDVAVISNIEKGKRELRVNELEKIANVLEVSVADLMTSYIMKEGIQTFEQLIIKNIIKIMNDKGLRQNSISKLTNISESKVSKMLSGSTKISLDNLSEIARALSVREIDIITYPKKYIEKAEGEEEPLEAILQIKLKKDKKEQVLKLVFGENNIEILNK